jgi:transposase
MQLDLNNLPTDAALLHRLVCDIAATIEHRDSEIERLKSIIKQLQRAQFGRRSEHLDPDQLALGLEDLNGDLARAHESGPRIENQPSERSSHRKPLPDHLPRDDVRLDIDDMICACCGGALHVIGESVSEMLDWIPAQLRVIRTTRPKYACRSCETVVQAPAPERVIAGGLATPALLAQVLVSKYCDHTPLYRQSQIFARHGVDLPRSTLVGWVGGACWWLEALHDRLAKNVFASDHLFADDTPVPVLDPGRGRTKTGRLWVYAREQRGWSGPEPPAAVFVYAPDRKAERPASHLEHFRGVLHVAMPASNPWQARATSCSPHAGVMHGASSTRWRRQPTRRSRPKHSAGSPNSMPLKPTFAVNPRGTGSRLAAIAPSSSSRRCGSGSKSSFLLYQAAARLPKRSATHSRAGTL